jgi:hemoglobin-like flavoprotein
VTSPRHPVGGQLPTAGAYRLRGSVDRIAQGKEDSVNLDLQALETSFDLVAPRGDELVDVFYVRLFATAPAVIPLFAGTDLARQRTMLLGTLVLLRKSLRDLDAIVPKLRELGARHVAYGAEPAHYPIVGEVLIASMAEIAGPAWTATYEQAWSEAFAIVAGADARGCREREVQGRCVGQRMAFTDEAELHAVRAGSGCEREQLPNRFAEGGNASRQPLRCSHRSR